MTTMPEADLPRALFVDDEPQVLEGLKRTLFDQFDVQMTTSGAAALEMLRRDGPFEVLVSDMRMPEMSGVQLLTQARKVAPDTTRILLTGQSDMESAIAAVNEGAIFRFLTKPCPPETMVSALNTAVHQFRLIRAERSVLEQTLVGTVRLMGEVLELAAPAAFQRTSRVRAIIAHIVRAMDIEDRWIYEAAAALCQIGCVALPNELLERVLAGQPLSAEEQRSYDAHPDVAYRLIRTVPRLLPVAEIVRRQLPSTSPEDSDQEKWTLGSDLLRLAIELDRQLANGVSPAHALEAVRQKTPRVRPEVFEVLRDLKLFEARQVVRTVTVKELTTGMTFDEDIHTRNGALVVAKGRQVDRVTIELLHRYCEGVGITEPFRVRLGVTDTVVP